MDDLGRLVEIFRLHLIGLAIACASCGAGPIEGVGCHNTIDLAYSPAAFPFPLSVSVIDVVSAEMFQLDCPSDAICEPGLIVIQADEGVPDDDVRVRFAREGDILLDEQLTLSIRAFTPNGEGTAPECSVGTATLSSQATK